MTEELIVARPTHALDYVMSAMTRNRIRHLTVLDDGALVGIISMGDVVGALVREKEAENRQLWSLRVRPSARMDV